MNRSVNAPYSIEQLADFAREHVASQDIDPVYPVLRHLLGKHPASEASLWRTFIYLAYYNLASAETALPMLDPDGDWPEAVLRLPTATERRGLRGGAPLAEHLRSLLYVASEHGSLVHWLAANYAHTGVSDSTLLAEMTVYRNWDRVGEAVREVHGNGRWASYKACEVLMKVNGLPLAAPDTGMAHSTGPRDGLALFFPEATLYKGNNSYHVDRLESMAWELRADLAENHGVDLGIEQLETCLCDFKAMAHGRYYVGKDIDEMLEQLYHPSVSEVARDRILDARDATLPPEYLGELYGRTGVDRARLKAFRDTGVILVRG